MLQKGVKELCFLTQKFARAIDNDSIHGFGFTGEGLMERAAEWIERFKEPDEDILTIDLSFGLYAARFNLNRAIDQKDPE